VSMPALLLQDPGERQTREASRWIRSILEGPVGRSAEIVSVWIVLYHEATPRLVTVMPGS